MDSVLVTADMFADLTSSVEANAKVIIPVGLGIMGLMVGVSLIPRILYKFL